MFTVSSRSKGLAALAVGSLITLTGCTPHAKVSEADRGTVQVSKENAGAPVADQKRFASLEEGAAMLKDAVLTKDRRMLITIFGSEGRDLVLTGDRVEENNDLEKFGAIMTEYMRVDRPTPQTAVLYMGKENWPFPIPLRLDGDQWFFDTVAGKEELLNRRIGENELNAIAVCRAYVIAQKQYAHRVRTDDGVTEYAQAFVSSPGKHDGLYWPVADGEELSPMGPLVAEAREEGYSTTKSSSGKSHPYQGYYFRILTAQGEGAPGGKGDYVVDGRLTKGFALIAYPSAWGSSGVMTFVVNQNGKVYQRNLGEGTKGLVKEITEYSPDKNWDEVKD